MDQASKLLLVAPKPALNRMLGDYLRAQGFTVSVASDGNAGLQQVAQGSCDLVILADLLQGLSGIEVLRRIRRQGELPVVMLTSGNDDVDRIVALELGADDCLSQSCNLRELTARLHAILRRSRHVIAAERLRASGLGSLGLSPAERQATWQGKSLRLTSTEYDLMEYLFNNAGRPTGKAELAMRVLGRELTPYDRSLDMHISNLRKKLGRLADGRSPIQTVRGGGYQLLRK